MTQLLYGAPVAEAQNGITAEYVSAARANGIAPKLTVLRVGDSAEADAYLRRLFKAAEKIGVGIDVAALPADASETQLLALVERLNADPSVHAILPFLPMPAHIDAKRACNAICPKKDADGVADGSMAAVYAGRGADFAPCTARACIAILKHYDIPLSGKHVAVVGRSLVVGRPAAMLALSENATVSVCHSRTENLAAIVRSADIVISATGKPRLLGADCFRAGQTVVDAGISVLPDGSLCGDADFEAADGIVDAITPVPGGVGAVTVSLLLQNAARSALITRNT